jgi:multicomponent Na+:H+ antiporter subunit G
MIDIIAYSFIGLGLLFFAASVVGVLRFPDFYTRMHAAGKGDTLSTILVVMGVALKYMHGHDWDFSSILVGGKLLAIIVFILIASPTSTHVLMRAGYEAGYHPFTKKEIAESKPEESEEQ